MRRERITDNTYRIKIKAKELPNVNVQQLITENQIQADVGYDYENNYIIMTSDFNLDKIEKLTGLTYE